MQTKKKCKKYEKHDKNRKLGKWSSESVEPYAEGKYGMQAMATDGLTNDTFGNGIKTISEKLLQTFVLTAIIPKLLHSRCIEKWGLGRMTKPL